ncbi:MAG: phage Gp37/Gp68 family protein [Oscillatoria sp. SIO1A7]|nr:phage Gp37/Gp68 family protein [Oscillatoria sp. SIO1A7]
MNTHTGIEWTDETWNPTTGCNKVSPGCAHCYAESMTKRFPNGFPNGFKFTKHPGRLDKPKTWRKPKRIFVNSMSDLFHEQMDIDFLQEAFQTIRETPWHIYQILTKRHDRLVELSSQLEWPDNVWMGVSVESQQYVKRVDCLRRVPAAVRFLSCEPLLGPLALDLTDIHWVIVGGESGPKHRPIDLDWARDIREQCRAAEVAFFFKQVGGRTPKAGGRHLDGEVWEEMPEAWETHCQKWNGKQLRPVNRKLDPVA